MILLNTLREPVVKDFTAAGFPGVKVTMRRLTAAEIEESRSVAAKAVRQLREGEEILAQYGMNGRDAAGQRFNAADPGQMFRLGVTIAAVEQALRAFTAWTGIYTAPGVVAEINRETLTILMNDPRFYQAAIAGLEEAARLIDVEKKDLSGSPTGSSGDMKAADSPIAGGAP